MEVSRLNSIDRLNKNNGKETNHPLVTVLDLSKAQPGPAVRVHFELYGVFLKESTCSSVKYGRNYYDYQDGTLLFVAPGQVVEIEDVDEKGLHQPSGLVLFFHPDLIRGTSLGQNINSYSFFSYNVNEALHVSEKERELVLDLFEKIKTEVEYPVDKHSKKLISDNIELLLNYCDRFYDRQFIVREEANKGVIGQFEDLLKERLKSEELTKSGMPTVAWCADQLNLSPKYFGDLIKKESGKSAQEYIHLLLINEAKERVLDSTKSISQIAYELGFSYPQHFSRLFKQKVGVSPLEWRSN
ncbi:helix-turn-helix domain-containing protein [Jiulongibacter sp. NS-SX5]|uniref:helix-turn-helix domain-containing protein n=1 Tax=Jiulongibacter sp. NS-SX5 TaxID=3463854 RepID=UPI0040589BD8